MDSEFIMAAFWFVFGALSFQLASYLLNLGRSILMVQQTVFGLLLMLKYYDKVFQGEKEKIIKKIKEDNPGSAASHKLLDLTLDAWRLQSVRSIKNYLPKKLQPLIRFDNWDQAMKFLDKVEKGLGK